MCFSPIVKYSKAVFPFLVLRRLQRSSHSERRRRGPVSTIVSAVGELPGNKTLAWEQNLGLQSHRNGLLIVMFEWHVPFGCMSLSMWISEIIACLRIVSIIVRKNYRTDLLVIYIWQRCRDATISVSFQAGTSQTLIIAHKCIIIHEVEAFFPMEMSF